MKEGFKKEAERGLGCLSGRYARSKDKKIRKRPAPTRKDFDLINRINNHEVADVKALLKDPSIDINIRDPYGRNGVFRAVMCGQIGFAAYLVREGCDLTQADASGDTVLHILAAYGHSRSIRLAIASGADVDVRNKKGETPLMRAIYGGRFESVSVLLKMGANPNLCDWNGNTALIWAATYQRDLCAGMLLTYGADGRLASAIDKATALQVLQEIPEDRQNSGYNATLAFLRADKKIRDRLEKLIEDGKDVNLSQFTGDRAALLRAAACKGEFFQTVSKLKDELTLEDLTKRGEERFSLVDIMSFKGEFDALCRGLSRAQPQLFRQVYDEVMYPWQQILWHDAKEELSSQLALKNKIKGSVQRHASDRMPKRRPK